LVVIATIVAKQNYNIVLNPNAYFIIFSTVVLSVEFYYFKGIALIKHFAFNNLKTMFLFALVSFVFAGIKEFLAFGKLYGKTIFSSFSGVEFFGSIVFSLILLAVLCFLFDIVVRIVEKKIKDRKLVYQKYVKIIRNEKAFQYDLLRREKLLANQVEVNRINRVEADKIIQKESENEAIESVKEVVTEESDIAVPEEKSDETDENNENTESISSEDTGEKNEAEESDKKKKHKKKGGKK